MDVFNAKITEAKILVDYDKFFGMENQFKVSIEFEAPGLSGDFGYNFLVGSDRIGHYIREILRLVGEKSWEKLPGRYIRVGLKKGKIYEIGHIVDNRWFNNDQFFSEPHIQK